MGEPARKLCSYQEYLALEVATGRRYEFFAGAVYAMAGGTPEHDGIKNNLIRALGNALEGRPCAVHGSDLKLRIEAAHVSTYPDVLVLCGQRERSGRDHNAVSAARVIVEVTSPSTAAYDRGDKLDYYLQLPSLEAYVIVAHDRTHVDVYERHPSGFLRRRAGEGETLTLAALELTLDVDAIYRDPLGGSYVRRDEERTPVPESA